MTGASEFSQGRSSRPPVLCYSRSDVTLGHTLAAIMTPISIIGAGIRVGKDG